LYHNYGKSYPIAIKSEIISYMGGIGLDEKDKSITSLLVSIVQEA
jgi:hypothetical protein